MRYYLGAVILCCTFTVPAARAVQPENLFNNPSFEIGREPWHMDINGKTVARFALDDREAVAGRYSARLSIAEADGWGVQFGQSVDGLEQGATYTFAVLAKSLNGPVTVALEVERRGKPYDRAGQSEPLVIAGDRWTELHVTFPVKKSFPQGCFAYVSCRQRGVEFRLDAFRLYQGPYVPYEQAAREAAQAAAVRVFDTGRPLTDLRPGEPLVEKSDWKKLAEDETKHDFAGDAVVMNDRLAFVLSSRSHWAPLYARGPKGFNLRALLAPSLTSRPAGISTFIQIVENSPSEVTVEERILASDGKSLAVRYTLAMGQTFVKTEPGPGVAALTVGFPCRFLVLPDFFADDIVVDAADIPVASTELPSENFLLRMLPGHEAIVMTVASNRDQDVRVELAGKGSQRLFGPTEIPYGPKGKVWVAVIEGRDVWHEHSVAPSDAGKIVPLKWKTPFAAQWRVDWRQADKLTGSWEMIAQRKDGEYDKYGWFGEYSTIPKDRKRWTTVLGRFEYPCWIDQAGQGYLQPLKRPTRFEGPALLYPINRARATPLDQFTVVDLVRATLGVGPCEYILDLEGQSQAMRGRATCATRDALGAIYGAHQQTQKRAEIERILGDVVIFVTHIRSRIEQYVAFGRELFAYLEQQKTAHPELAEFIAEMESLTATIQANYDRRKEHIKTPQYVIDLTEEFRRTLLDDEGSDALAKCTKITHAIVVVGGNQDELVGESRMAVKVLRQRAGLAMAIDPRAADVAKEIRRRTQAVLRNPASYEAPRH